MADAHGLRIVFTDRLERSLVIGFSDGRNGRFDVELLHAMLSRGVELFEPAALDDLAASSALPEHV